MQDAVLYFYHHITVVNFKDASFEAICQVRNLTNLAYFEMESRIFDCVDNDDVEGLKLLMDYPNIFQIEDTSGYTILQRAIRNKRIAVFYFLLSLDGYPIDARNSEGKTALQVALIDPRFEKNEHFSYSLLKNGANIDCIGDTEILCIAIRCGWFDVVQYLIEKGVDLNCYCDSEYSTTPLHELYEVGTGYGVEVEDLLAMMLCFGADPLIPDYEGFKPIDQAFFIDYITEEMQEHLVFYVFDDYCTDYVIPTRSLFDLIQSDPPFAPQILKYVTAVDIDEDSTPWPLEYFFIRLFEMEAEYLKLLLEKFDYVVESVIKACLERFETSPEAGEAFSFWRRTHVANFHLLLQSQFSSDLIQLKTQIVKFIIRSISEELPQSELFDLILVALNYGAILYDEDLEVIYETWGDCEFFRILLHMDIKVENRNRKRNGIMSWLLYDIHMDIETFLNEPQNCKWSENAVKHLLNYFAHPKLKSFCDSLESDEIYVQVKDLPAVQLLVELARNEVRKFLIKKYKIKNSMQFYTLIKRLPISKIHQKIITLETKLY